jgi:4-amino-4-deoxy-L-arabinose transferase-like glycosyltransferase
LLLIFLLAAIFRFASLGYSEFQGDEALAMISAAEAIEGHPDALFLRGKGPGEVLLPMMVWRLTGTIDEGIARLPFAIAGLLLVVSIYLLGRRRLFRQNERIGLLAALIAAGLLALNGFMVAFSRIVQYQTLVVWMSALALLCAWEWRTRPAREASTWAALTGAFLGAGLLAHYDAILVVPALITIQISNIKYQISKSLISNLSLFTAALLIVAGLFYVPYALDPQIGRTGAYLGDRIGDALLKNNLDSFVHFSVFYNSAYYVLVSGMLVVGFVAWALRRAPGVSRLPYASSWIPALAAVIVLGLTLWPGTLRVAGLDLAALPFGLILLGAFLSRSLDIGQRALVAWLAVPFLGYNFAVALPLTHIYTTVPAWSLLAGLSAAGLIEAVQTRVAADRQGRESGNQGIRESGNRQTIQPSNHPSFQSSTHPPIQPSNHPTFARWLLLAGLLFTALFSGYLYVAYLRHDVEFQQDWPASRPRLYWSPYAEPPPAGFFGFVHRAGWKGVGALYAQGSLAGDYASNEEPEVTTWYTRGAPRACDAQPEYYFITDDLIDPWPVDRERIDAGYTAVGRISLSNGKELAIYQAQPTTANLGDIQAHPTFLAFDRSATPDAFARSARGSSPAQADFGGLVRLIGYHVDERRAWPDGRLSVTLYWQAQAPIAQDYHVFVHLQEAEPMGQAPAVWGQADGRPVCWTYPTFDWRPGQIIADQHAIAVQPNTPAGEYDILVGLYELDTGARLEVLDDLGKPVTDYVKLPTVSIER